MQTIELLSGRAGMLFLIILFSMFLFSSCNSQKPGLDNIVVKNGLIYNIESGELYTGKVHDLIYSQVLEYDVVKGLKDGDFNIFSENGKILVSGQMRKNKNEGLWQYFYPNGELESQGYFKNDNTSDKWYWYYPDGKLKTTGSYIDGKKDGKWTEYDENGKVISEEVFRKNIKVAGMEEKLT
jgi:antitoxin component YwqK of YwqJK toxin-antitoxin module